MDFSLSDVAWVGGGLIAFTLLRVAWAFRADIAQAMAVLMSRREGAANSANTVVYRPVEPTSMEVNTTPAPASGMPVADTPASSDMDAKTDGMEWGPTPVSRYLTDDEFIIFLATQKLRNGKYRMSANDVVKATHGDRNHILAVVRQVREGVPEYKPLTPEQQAARKELGLTRS